MELQGEYSRKSECRKVGALKQKAGKQERGWNVLQCRGRDLASTYVLHPHCGNLGVSISEGQGPGKSIDLVAENMGEEGDVMTSDNNQLSTVKVKSSI